MWVDLLFPHVYTSVQNIIISALTKKKQKETKKNQQTIQPTTDRYSVIHMNNIHCISSCKVYTKSNNVCVKCQKICTSLAQTPIHIVYTVH